MNRKGTFAALLWLCALLPAPASEDPEKDTITASSKEPEPTIITLRGRVVSIYDALKQRHSLEVTADTGPLYGFQVEDANATIYTLIKTRRSEALYLDERLRNRELILKGRLFPGTQIFEPTFMQSVKDGVVHDLYYYCDVCAIQSVTPAVCECCREPVRLVEEPVK